MLRRGGAIVPGLMLLLGVLAVQWLPELPSRWICLSMAAVALGLAWRCSGLRWFAWGLFGVAWACWRGGWAMESRLPHAWEGRDLQVVGTVSDLPTHREDATGFILSVAHAELDGLPVRWQGRVRVNWYKSAPTIEPCSRWQLTLRLKRPRGLINPGGGDSERTALERGIVATAYVRDEASNTALGQAAFCIDRVRDSISHGIAARVADTHDASLLQVFAVGDIRGLNQQDWEVARANGIPHLISISGFHVGVAALVGSWLARLLYGLFPSVALRVPRPPSQAAFALMAAGIYSALAGFGLPTVRTMLMIGVVALARCLRRQPTGLQSLAMALVVVLLFDPLSVLAAGFWLSFVGVAFLMLCLTTRGRGLRGFLHELSAGQLVMTLALLPLTMWFFGEASLVGALSNLIAVPFVSFVIVPCTLLGMLLLGLCPPFAAPMLWLAGVLSHLQWWLLERMATWPGAHWYLSDVRLWALLLGTLGALWLFTPRGVPMRWLGVLLLLPLLLPPRSPIAAGAFQLWVLDVGQGLAVLLRTQNHALVYDAGARYPSDFDLGEAVVLRSMRGLGMRRLDLLVASHADNDHAGGVPAVARAFPGAQRFSGEPERLPLPMAACEAGQSWVWDGVTVRVLPSGAPSGPSNDRSCVLLVEGRGGRALLAGDISARIEPTVASAVAPGPPLVLSVPHHGSRSSSSASFIAATRPMLALISAGWRNRFGHPHPLVIQRYDEAGVPWLNTASVGAIRVDFPADAPPRVVSQEHLQQSRYWRE